jgi:YVTN family beta-propeller protein
MNELTTGLHPNAIISSPDQNFLYVANANSDYISVIDAGKETVIDSIEVGLFSHQNIYYGSSPNGLCISPDGATLYVANGLDNAVAVVQLGSHVSFKGIGKTLVEGYIPTEAYPSGIALLNNKLYITNLEAKGSKILSEASELKPVNGRPVNAYSIHKELTSVSIIPVPAKTQLSVYTQRVQQLSLSYRLVASLNQLPRKNVLPKPVPERIGEPSIFKHVVYIIKENKTYDQVYGDVKEGNGDSDLCVYGNYITPNQHELSHRFSLLDNYYASGKCSAEGHQWTDAAMVSDYVEKNVRAWFRSYPHRQEDVLVYNKSGFIWNDALDHGKKVRIFGEACKTNYDTKLNWFDIYNKYVNHDSLNLKNTTTIARIRPVIHPGYPDCDNLVFTDQLRADAFINEWNKYEDEPGDSLPDLMILSLPNDHTEGTTPNFPTPRAMVADNDLALGRIIQTIAGSRFWNSTVVFVTEDDSQSGWDHVSPYRTTGLVISPYSALKKTVHTNYNQTCIVRTIEQILGIPPMNIIDATALPMFDCFTDKATKEPFHFIQNNIPLNEKNKSFAVLKGKALYFARLSMNSSFKNLDSGDDDNMNRILWFDAKGSVPYPVF